MESDIPHLEKESYATECAAHMYEMHEPTVRVILLFVRSVLNRLEIFCRRKISLRARYELVFYLEFGKQDFVKFCLGRTFLIWCLCDINAQASTGRKFREPTHPHQAQFLLVCRIFFNYREFGTRHKRSYMSVVRDDSVSHAKIFSSGSGSGSHCQVATHFEVRRNTAMRTTETFSSPLLPTAQFELIADGYSQRAYRPSSKAEPLRGKRPPLPVNRSMP